MSISIPVNITLLQIRSVNNQIIICWQSKVWNKDFINVSESLTMGKYLFDQKYSKSSNCEIGYYYILK